MPFIIVIGAPISGRAFCNIISANVFELDGDMGANTQESLQLMKQIYLHRMKHTNTKSMLIFKSLLLQGTP